MLQGSTPGTETDVELEGSWFGGYQDAVGSNALTMQQDILRLLNQTKTDQWTYCILTIL